MKGKFKLAAMCMSLILLSSLVSHAVIAQAPLFNGRQFPLLQTEDYEESENWLTYIDPQYGFSLRYPENWQVTSRFGKAMPGTTLTFSPSIPQPIGDSSEPCTSKQNSPFKVEIGMSLVEWERQESLSSWLAKYNQMSSISKSSTETIEKSLEIRIDSRVAIEQEGKSAQTEYKYVVVPRGNIIWFIWTNVDEAYEPIFDRLVASFKFGKSTPMTLQEAYGEDFQSLPIDLQERTAIPGPAMRPPGLVKRNYTFNAIGCDWIVPVRGYHTVGCDSAWHVGSAAYAVDVTPLSEWTDIYASQGGNVVFAGYGWNDGYGNLVKIQSGSYTDYEAHQKAIDGTSIVETTP